MNKNICLFLLLIIIAAACSKTTFLDAKPDQSLVVPQTLENFQAILDNDHEMNGADWGQGLVPQLGESGADNYYLSDDFYNQVIQQQERNVYTWEKDIYTGDVIYDWNIPYRAIFNANVVIEGISKLSITEEQQETYDRLMGSALFYRAHCFYQLAQVFAPPYQTTTAATDWGIPLRLTGDVNEKPVRATLKDTYEKIISDLNAAGQLLPATTTYKTRPGQVAVYALLSRIYQTMQQYDNALHYAEKSLAIQDDLMDYNDFNTDDMFPFPVGFNKEVIFHCSLVGWSSRMPPIMPYIGGIPPSFYDLFDEDDLRKSLFFSDVGFLTFTGSYDGGSGGGDLFSGLATDEIYLIKAECLARSGQVQASMDALHTLMTKRWKTGKFAPTDVANAQEALQKVLAERRKELCFRGLRWTDLRRLNLEGAGITLTRTVNGITFTLPPNDPRYTYPIPSQVMGFHPDMPQNPR